MRFVSIDPLINLQSKRQILGVYLNMQQYYEHHMDLMHIVINLDRFIVLQFRKWGMTFRGLELIFICSAKYMFEEYLLVNLNGTYIIREINA